jgi:hypothetical protein
MPIEVVSDELQWLCAIEPNNEPTVSSEVQALVQEYEHLFATPSELPPAREADHQINLMLGAQLVRVRPYHYSI